MARHCTRRALLACACAHLLGVGALGEAAGGGPATAASAAPELSTPLRATHTPPTDGAVSEATRYAFNLTDGAVDYNQLGMKVGGAPPP